MVVDIDSAVIARLKKGGHIFEILVDCDAAMAYREKKIDSLDDVAATDEIFEDVKKGMVASREGLQATFNTTDITLITKEIVLHGTIQLTAEYQRAQRDAKKTKLIHLIHRTAVDPRSGIPHPVQRIENAFEEVHVRIEEHTSPEEQLKTVVDQLRSVLPLKFEVHTIEFIIPASYAGKCYGTVKQFALVKKEEWLSNGSLLLLVEVSPGVQEDLEEALNAQTRGSVEMKIVKKA